MSPAARPVARSGAPRIAKPGTGSETASATELVPHAPSSRISSRHLDSIASALTTPDLHLLRFLCDVRLASGEQIVRRFWDEPTASNARAARRQLARLRGHRLIAPLPRAIGGVRAGSAGLVYGLDVAGLRILQRYGLGGRRLQTPGERFVRHTLAITEVVVGFHEAQQRGELDLIEVQTEPTSWRSYAGAWGARASVKPDLYCRIGAGALEDSWFVEVDLATNSKATEAKKLRSYLAHYKSGAEQSERGVYPRVLWATAGEKRERDIRGLVASMPAAHQALFSVCPLADITEFVAAEARS